MWICFHGSIGSKSSALSRQFIHSADHDILYDIGCEFEQYEQKLSAQNYPNPTHYLVDQSPQHGRKQNLTLKICTLRDPRSL